MRIDNRMYARETAVRDVNRTEFIGFYEANYRRVYNYISYRITSRSDVEDLVSGVFSRVLEKCSTFDPSRGTEEMWVIGIARNAVTDYFRENATRKRIEIKAAAEYDPPDEKPDELLIWREERERLLSALETLDERERHVIALRYGAELTNHEIARQMGLGISNIGVILFRALRKLRKELEKEVRP